jgi:hypothetical protein
MEENNEIYNDENFEVGSNEHYEEYSEYQPYGRRPRRNNIPEGSNNAGNVVSWVEKLGGFINRQGLKNTFLTVMVLFLCVVVGYYAFNPTAVLDRVNVKQEQEHNEAIQKRKSADQIIRTSIVDMRNNLGAHRAFVFETHNGGNNMAGLPFLYVDMTYDEPVAGMKKLQDEYKNVSQTRYGIMDEIFETTFWCGTLEDIEEQDKELYYRMVKEDVTYLALMLLYGEYNPVGAVGITYNDPNAVIPPKSVIQREMYKYATQITSALTGN